MFSRAANRICMSNIIISTNQRIGAHVRIFRPRRRARRATRSKATEAAVGTSTHRGIFDTRLRSVLHPTRFTYEKILLFSL